MQYDNFIQHASESWSECMEAFPTILRCNITSQNIKMCPVSFTTKIHKSFTIGDFEPCSCDLETNQATELQVCFPFSKNTNVEKKVKCTKYEKFCVVSPFLKTLMYKKYVEKYKVWKSFYGLLGEGVFTANPLINIKKVAKKIYYSLVNIVMFLLPGGMIISNMSIFCFCLKWNDPDQMVVRWPYMVLSYQDVQIK